MFKYVDRTAGEPNRLTLLQAAGLPEPVVIRWANHRTPRRCKRFRFLFLSSHFSLLHAMQSQSQWASVCCGHQHVHDLISFEYPAVWYLELWRAQLRVWGSRLIRTNSQTSGSWWEASWRWYERCSLLFPHSQILFFKDPGHASYAPATGGFHPMPHGTYVETHNRVVRIFSRRRANRNDSDYYILIDHTVLSRWGQCSRAAFHAVSITWRGYKDFK